MVFELRTWYFLGKRSTTVATLPARSAPVIFDTGSCFMPRPAWTAVFLFVLPWVASDDRCTPLQTAFGWDGVFWTFYPDWLQTAILQLSAFQAVRIIGLSHSSWRAYMRVTEDRIQGLKYDAKQVFYYWATSPPLFKNFLFWNKISLTSPDWPLTFNAPALTSWVTEITDVCHHTQQLLYTL
jgi:hypothetical protein